MNKPAKLSCRHVWKVFGKDAEQLFAKGRIPNAEDMQAGGYIGAVRDVCLEVHEGEIFIIMGLSGSGKSTLIRCLTRLIQPTHGEVLFDALNLLKANTADLINMRRHKMGMVFQHFALLPHRTVLGNVAFPLEIQGVDRQTREDRALKVIELVGLSGREGYYPRELSGGQQQRVGIARSLAVKPDVWFLDEPFSALDPLIRREMQDEFLRLQNMLHKTIIFITHDFDEAIRLADRIAIMKDGEIIQVGTPEDVVLHPATDYIRKFRQGVPRAKVLSAGTLMSALSNRPLRERVDASTRIEKLITRAADMDKGDAFAVVENGTVVGELPREAVFSVFADESSDT